MKGKLLSFLEFLVISTIATSLNPVCICLITFYLTGHPVLFSLLLTVFSGTLLIYTMNRFTDRKEDMINNPQRFRFLDRFGKPTLTIAAVLYCISLVLVLQLNPATFLVALLPMVIAVSYSVFRVKHVFLLKNIVVSLGLLCAVLIVLITYNDFTTFSLLLAVFFLFSYLVNTIIFDIKDIEGDVLHDIRTLPGKYGIWKTKVVCFGLLFFTASLIPALALFNSKSNILFLYVLYIGFYIAFADVPDRLPSWYYGIFVDGENLFLASFCGILLIMKILA